MRPAPPPCHTQLLAKGTPISLQPSPGRSKLASAAAASYRFPAILQNGLETAYGFIDILWSRFSGSIAHAFKQTRQPRHGIAGQASLLQMQCKFVRGHSCRSMQMAFIGYNVAHTQIAIDNHIAGISARIKIV